MSNELSERCSVIEECYEFMLAYAGQGVSGQSDGLIRDFLSRAAQALAGIEEAYASAVPPRQAVRRVSSSAGSRRADSLAAVELVLAQPAISSQLIDNLNASIHLRALLTDLFLIDEILKGSQNPAGASGSAS